VTRPLVLFALVITLAACDLPTEPDGASLAGAYEGSILAFPSGEDWTNVRLTIDNGGTGTLVARNGATHSVTGQRIGSLVHIDVHDLPAATPCDVSLVVTDVTAEAIRGGVTGRCPNTLLSEFRLTRL
jgi:hypothetical protein